MNPRMREVFFPFLCFIAERLPNCDCVGWVCAAGDQDACVVGVDLVMPDASLCAVRNPPAYRMHRQLVLRLVGCSKLCRRVYWTDTRRALEDTLCLTIAGDLSRRKRSRCRATRVNPLSRGQRYRKAATSPRVSNLILSLIVGCVRCRRRRRSNRARLISSNSLRCPDVLGALSGLHWGVGGDRV